MTSLQVTRKTCGNHVETYQGFIYLQHRRTKYGTKVVRKVLKVLKVLKVPGVPGVLKKIEVL